MQTLERSPMATIPQPRIPVTDDPADAMEIRRLLLQRQDYESETACADRAEMEDAIATQHGLLPRSIPQLAGIDISVAWVPARQMSGDYLDLIRLGQRRVGLAVGDVVGKGLAAALLMSNLQAAVRALAGEDHAPEALAARVNRIMSVNTGRNKFITFFYGVVEGRRLAYTNAGHNAPMLVHANASHSRLDAGGVVLGVFPEWVYRQESVELSGGDRLLLFSDGVTEAEDRHGEPFGEQRLLELLRSHRELDATPLRKKIMASVTAFTGGRFQDDATLVVLAVEAARARG